MSEKVILAVPSKGRLMDDTIALFADAGLTIRKTGHARGYRGEIAGWPEVDVAFVSASEIATQLKAGAIHLGVTGEDVVREKMADSDARVQFVKKLGFGFADVVVAVPDWWVDVRTMADLEAAAMPFRRVHGRFFRVATKYMTLTRKFFSDHGFGDYRIVESLGATEGAPAAGSAELIVDITTTGETLRANGLRILDDGTILKSEANLVVSRSAPAGADVIALRQKLLEALGVSEGRSP